TGDGRAAVRVVRGHRGRPRGRLRASGDRRPRRPGGRLRASGGTPRHRHGRPAGRSVRAGDGGAHQPRVRRLTGRQTALPAPDRRRLSASSWWTPGRCPRPNHWYSPIVARTWMRREIAEQGETVGATLAEVRRHADDIRDAMTGRRRILLVARGSSDNAA